MAKIIIHPATQKIFEKLEARQNRILNEEMKGNPFIPSLSKGLDDTFDKFLEKTETLEFAQEILDNEARMFNKELSKDPNFLSQYLKLAIQPKNSEELKAFEKLGAHYVEIAKNCGAVHIAENLKITIDLMIETAKKAPNFDKHI
ncbi:hypothetical protein J6E39_04460 [bacterium]|nr:hypothetical protein [bacterium]